MAAAALHLRAASSSIPPPSPLVTPAPGFWPPSAPGPVMHSIRPQASVPAKVPVVQSTITVSIIPSQPTKLPSSEDPSKRKAINQIKQINAQLSSLKQEIATLDAHIDEIEKIRKRIRRFLRRGFPFTVIEPKPQDSRLLEQRVDEKLAELQREILKEFVAAKKEQKELWDKRDEIVDSGLLGEDELEDYETYFLSLARKGLLVPEAFQGGEEYDADGEYWEDVEDDDDDDDGVWFEDDEVY